jgi:hypothetical protein
MGGLLALFTATATSNLRDAIANGIWQDIFPGEEAIGKYVPRNEMSIFGVDYSRKSQVE